MGECGLSSVGAVVGIGAAVGYRFGFPPGFEITLPNQTNGMRPVKMPVPPRSCVSRFPRAFQLKPTRGESSAELPGRRLWSTVSKLRLYEVEDPADHVRRLAAREARRLGLNVGDIPTTLEDLLQEQSESDDIYPALILEATAKAVKAYLALFLYPARFLRIQRRRERARSPGESRSGRSARRASKAR